MFSTLLAPTAPSAGPKGQGGAESRRFQYGIVVLIYCTILTLITTVRIARSVLEMLPQRRAPGILDHRLLTKAHLMMDALLDEPDGG